MAKAESKHTRRRKIIKRRHVISPPAAQLETTSRAPKRFNRDEHVAEGNRIRKDAERERRRKKIKMVAPTPVTKANIKALIDRQLLNKEDDSDRQKIGQAISRLLADLKK
jgi:hypothetical protein